jgi:hypothetical protein
MRVILSAIAVLSLSLPALANGGGFGVGQFRQRSVVRQKFRAQPAVAVQVGAYAQPQAFVQQRVIQQFAVQPVVQYQYQQQVLQSQFLQQDYCAPAQFSAPLVQGYAAPAVGQVRVRQRLRVTGGY